MTTIRKDNDVFEVRGNIVPKPISVYSKDPTDFQIKKYINLGDTYYINGKIVSLEEFKRRLRV